MKRGNYKLRTKHDNEKIDQAIENLKQWISLVSCNGGEFEIGELYNTTPLIQELCDSFDFDLSRISAWVGRTRLREDRPSDLALRRGIESEEAVWDTFDSMRRLYGLPPNRSKYRPQELPEMAHV